MTIHYTLAGGVAGACVDDLLITDTEVGPHCGKAPPEDEASDAKELSRRWDSAVVGLRNTELEFSIGNLAENDYDWLKEQYMTEAALVLKTMELEEHQEQELMEDVERAVRGIRGDVESPEGEQ